MIKGKALVVFFVCYLSIGHAQSQQYSLASSRAEKDISFFSSFLGLIPGQENRLVKAYKEYYEEMSE
ncbi:MAG TPA: hypothetical protein VFM18_12685, partial [Methanosarcina sp.]|nr:hypothetical protein [Methanosarcina sp.]